MYSLIKSPTSLIGAFIFSGIALYIFMQYGMNTQLALAGLITVYFLVASFFGIKSQVTFVARLLMMSIVLLYVISIYMY